MALNGQDFHFHYSVASGYQDEQDNPNQSLGGYYSVDRVEEVEGAVTTQVSDAFFTSTDLIDDKPASPDTRTPLSNSGNYVSAGNLVHWYRPAVDDAAMGTDYATAGTPRDLGIQRNLDSTDVSSEQPGQFDQQRYSVGFEVTSDETITTGGSPVTFGIANEWSISAWLRTTTIGLTTSRYVRLGTSPNAESTNEISLIRYGQFIRVTIADSTVAADRKDKLYFAMPNVDTWYHIVVTWDGTNLTVYADGSPIAPFGTVEDDSVTQTDASRYMLISGLGATLSNPTEEWEGQIHSVCIWDVELSASEVADLAGFGDGVGAPALDFTGDWVVFVTGNNAVDARQIIYYDPDTGDVGVTPEWASTPVVSEVFRIAGPLSLFDDLDSDESSGGHVDHRMIYLRNDTGSILNDIRLYLEPLDPCGTKIEVAMGSSSKGSNLVTPISDEEEAPDLDTTGTNGFTTTTPQRFRASWDYDSAEEVPYDVVNAGISTHYPIWLRRTVPEHSKRMDSAAWLLVAEQNTGVKTAVPIVFDINGYTPLLSAAFDRTPRTFGGGRIDVSVEDAEAGYPIEDEEVYAAIDSGPGTLNVSGTPFETDEDGEAYAVYISPEDDAEADSEVVVEVKIGGDP